MGLPFQRILMCIKILFISRGSSGNTNALRIRIPNYTFEPPIKKKREICTEEMKAIRFSEMIHFSFRAVNVSGTSILIHVDVRYAIIYFKRGIREY